MMFAPARNDPTYWGFRLLPHDRRRALCAVYAFCRVADDMADERPHVPAGAWRRQAGLASRDGRDDVLADVIELHNVEQGHGDAHIF